MKKASISSFFIILTASFKSVRPMVWFTAISPLTESSAQWHTNKWDTLDPFKEVRQLIYFTLFDYIYDSIDVPVCPE